MNGSGAAEGAGRRRRRRVSLVLLAPLIAIAAFVASPLPPALLDRSALHSTRVTDREGGTLRDLVSQADGRSIALPTAEPIPPRVRAAFIAAEDKRFGRHPGIDPIAIGRALVQDLRARRIVSGASTIAGQLGRILVPRPRSLTGKVTEALWAMRLTAHLDRDRLLREYLDRVALGHDLYGVEAAAETYFGRPARALSTEQAALLAGLASSPEASDPWRKLPAAVTRMRRVLLRMERAGSISAEERRVAENAPLDLVPAPRAFSLPHLTTWIASHREELGLADAARIETTIDPSLQSDVEQLMRAEIAGLNDRNVNEAAAIVIDNASGEVLAYVGSVDFFDEDQGGQNDGVRALRQPGSALKPFAYGLGISRGRTPADLLPDVETHLATATGDYVPKNYDRRVHGPVRLREALANSYNVPAVRLTEELGPERVLGVLRSAGFDSLTRDPSEYGVGIVLGDGDVTLRELGRAYRGLARGGVVGPLVEIRLAWSATGEAIPLQPEMKDHRFLPAAAVALLTDIISDEAARAPAFGMDNALRLPFPVAAKTGTSRAYVDNWCAGFTHERTVAVWVGNFNGSPMRKVSGITGAGPIFKRVMIRAMQGITPQPLVDRSRFETAEICPLSGRLATDACPARVREFFLPGTTPTAPCPMHRVIEGKTSLDVGPEFYTWAAAEGIPGGPRPGGSSSSSGKLLLPMDGDEYLLEPGLPAEAQAIPVRALAPGSGEIELRVDGATPIALPSPYATQIAARPGPHRIELWLKGGHLPLATAHFSVLGGDP
jgi:penicillin-binding protein 1C